MTLLLTCWIDTTTRPGSVSNLNVRKIKCTTWMTISIKHLVIYAWIKLSITCFANTIISLTNLVLFAVFLHCDQRHCFFTEITTSATVFIFVFRIFLGGSWLVRGRSAYLFCIWLVPDGSLDGFTYDGCIKSTALTVIIELGCTLVIVSSTQYNAGYFLHLIFSISHYNPSHATGTFSSECHTTFLLS